MTKLLNRFFGGKTLKTGLEIKSADALFKPPVGQENSKIAFVLKLFANHTIFANCTLTSSFSQNC
jgi:hypothetical protein